MCTRTDNPRRSVMTLASIVISALSSLPLQAAEKAVPVSGQVEAQVTAIRKAIGPLQRAAQGSSEQRTCFTCHSQAVPVFALAEAAQRGFAVDQEILDNQVQHTAAHLKRGRKNYQAGKGQGGRVLTAGYALWALDAVQHKPDDVTNAVAHFLLEYQKNEPHWHQDSQRPPSSGSDFTATYVALRGLDHFGTDEQQEAIAQRKSAITEWFVQQQPQDTEDHVFRLRSLTYLDLEEAQTKIAVDSLLDLQRDDGGWAQLPDSNSDAYATGTALTALLRDGGLPADHPAVQRGLKYLLDTQLDDGTWHVKTRAKGFQTYFETGFPHGKDQFISTAASAWSMLALTLSLPDDLKVPDAEVAEASHDRLRVMSFNIRYGLARDGDNEWKHRHELVIETIRNFNPDLLGTQEVLGFQAQYLDEQLPEFTYSGSSRDKNPDGEQCGILFRTDRFELIDSGQFWLSETPEKPFTKSWDSSLPRIAAWVRLKDRRRGGSELLFVNTHFDHRGKVARLESARLLRQWIERTTLDRGDEQADVPVDATTAAKKSDRSPSTDKTSMPNSTIPLILTGDFNCGEDSAPYTELITSARLSDSYRQHHSERQPDEGTFNGFRGTTTGGRIDWILTSPEWSVMDAGIDRTHRDGRYPSDHFPVTAIVRPAQPAR